MGTEVNDFSEIDPRLAGYRKWEGFDPFEELTGPYFYRQGPDGSFRCALLLQGKQLSSAGAMHGGALMTFADYSLFVFALPLLNGISAVTVSLHADFTAPAQAGEFLESTGEIVHETKSLIFVRGQIFSGSRILLTFSGVLRKVRPKVKEAG
ncbi:MAG: PaaI family thioesterase [Desulfuromonadales bacterium]|nr:PaaI family thioesterase [Desulfuromonadales bacterium]